MAGMDRRPVEALAAAFASLRLLGVTHRDTFSEILRRTLDAQPALLGAWSVWEPDSIDGRDAAFRFAPGHDATGRFVPYWHRAYGSPKLDPVAGRLLRIRSVTPSTVEYGPIAADTRVPVKLVTSTNPSTGTDKIILAPSIKDPKELKGQSVAVLEGGLTQIFMGIWFENQGLKFDVVKYSNVVMDDAVAAMVVGKVLESLQGARAVTTSLEPYWLETALLGDGM